VVRGFTPSVSKLPSSTCQSSSHQFNQPTQPDPPAAGGGKLVFEGAPWNGSTLALIAAAKAHCELTLARTFFDATDRWAARGDLPAEALLVMGRVGALFGLWITEKGLAPVLEDGYMSGECLTGWLTRWLTE
jgi:hypothetical protein